MLPFFHSLRTATLGVGIFAIITLQPALTRQIPVQVMPQRGKNAEAGASAKWQVGYGGFDLWVKLRAADAAPCRAPGRVRSRAAWRSAWR